MLQLVTTAFSLLLCAAVPAIAQKHRQSTSVASAKPAYKFLDAIQAIAMDRSPVEAPSAALPEVPKAEPAVANPDVALLEMAAIESATLLQLKYAILLNTEVEQIQNGSLFTAIDEWYGTRYKLGGNTKAGIDCSAFVQAIYNQVFQMPMPRTSREQHKAVQTISRAELKPGDLIFFNTRGSGISHVGIYLQNNKFVHAATSSGVMVSDLFDDYWRRRFYSAGRYMPQAPLLAVEP